MIIYTSGTTGKPKGTLHVHGGFPVKAAQDMAHGFDIGAEDTVFWFTDLGWMMGPWLIFGTLALGATMVLYEGTPDHPAPDRLWRMVAQHRVTVFGVSPTLVRGLMTHGDEPPSRHDLSSLRILGGTGEPWNPEPFNWFFKHVGGSRIPIINYTGGTEIAGGILCGNVITHLRPTSFAGPLPGIAADVVDAEGKSVRGEVGELEGEVLVCFVILRTGQIATHELEVELEDLVAAALGKPLRPKAVHFVSDLPRTRNAKILRRVVRSVYTGKDPGDLSSLENPSALAAIGATRS